MDRAHQFDRGRGQDAHTIQLAPVGKHLGKAIVVLL
jgi:hypothetical protein